MNTRDDVRPEPPEKYWIEYKFLTQRPRKLQDTINEHSRLGWTVSKKLGMQRSPETGAFTVAMFRRAKCT